MADYPSAITSFPTLVDGVTPIEAGRHNDVADEIVAIETELGTNPKGTHASVSVLLAELLSGWNSIPGATWSYSSADAPTFVISINADVTSILSVGMRIQLIQTTTKYFIVTAVGSYSAGATLVTVFGGTDYVLSNAAISSPVYSLVKAPKGFPLLPSKWKVSLTDTSDRTDATPPAQNTWINVGSTSLSLPIGAWLVSYKVFATANITFAAVASASFRVTLSTANNSQSDVGATAGHGTPLPIVTGGNLRAFLTLDNYVVNLAVKTTYYLNMLAATSSGGSSLNSITYVGASLPTSIEAVSAYL